MSLLLLIYIRTFKLKPKLINSTFASSISLCFKGALMRGVLVYMNGLKPFMYNNTTSTTTPRNTIYLNLRKLNKLALTDFDSIFEVKVQVREGAMRAL